MSRVSAKKPGGKGAKSLDASLSKRGNAALAAGFRCSLFGRGNEPYGSTSTAHQKQTYTNKQSGSKLEGGGVGVGWRRKGRMVHRSGMFSCSPVPQTAAISTC